MQEFLYSRLKEFSILDPEKYQCISMLMSEILQCENTIFAVISVGKTISYDFILPIGYNWNFKINFINFLYPIDYRVALILLLMGVIEINKLEQKYLFMDHGDIFVIFSTINNILSVTINNH